MFLTDILFILLLKCYKGNAFPTSSNETYSSQAHVLVGLPEPQSRRTLFNIIWSCIVTVIVCAWVSIRPNVPPSNGAGGPLRMILRKTKMMFWAIMAPELVVAWAMQQWLAARAIRDTYNSSPQGSYKSKRWTTIHGHFVTMGALQLVNEEIKKIEEPAEPGPLALPEDRERYDECYDDYRLKVNQCRLGPLTRRHLTDLVETHNFVIPTITVAEIKDRSKEDRLFELIAILQILWFIIQCVARRFQEIALTHLELVTLAIVSLNVTALAFWWRKPFGVEEAVNVFVPQKLWEQIARDNQRRDHNSVEGDNIDITACRLIHGTADKFILATKFIFDPLRYRRERPDRPLSSSIGLYIIRLPYRIFFVLTYPIFLVFPFATLLLFWITKKPEIPRTQDNNIRRLHDLPYNLTHSARKYFGNNDGPLGKISISEYYRNYQHPAFVLNWFFVIPASFFLFLFLLIILSPLFAISLISAFILTVTFGLDPPNMDQHGTYIPAFYAPRTQRHPYPGIITFAFCCAIAGAIHCIGWNFTFSNDVRRLEWRIAALALTIIPYITALFAILIGTLKKSFQLEKLKDFLTVQMVFIYVVAKAILIYLALDSLTRQPDAAFYTVDWVKYIPHLVYPQ